MMKPKLSFCGLSDIGLNRPTNQDVWAARPEIGFFALADGMGGRRGGEIAAKEAIQILCESIGQIDGSLPPNWFHKLREAIERANRWVFQMGSQNPSLLGMGTTLCCLLWTDQRVYIAHVGDSRIYRFQSGHLQLLTRDHSLLEKWLSNHCLDSPTPPKNIITRAIGTPRPANPEISSYTYCPGDLFFLCSDGLSDALPQEELEQIIIQAKTVNRAAKKMIHCAKKRGSGDNITVLMIACDSNLSLENEPAIKNGTTVSR